MLTVGIAATVLGSYLFQAVLVGICIGVGQYALMQLARGGAEPWLVRHHIRARIYAALNPIAQVDDQYIDDVYEGCMAIEDLLVAYILEYKQEHWCPHMCNDRDLLMQRVQQIAAAYFVPQGVVEMVRYESLEQLRQCMTAHGYEESYRAYLAKTYGDHHEAP